MGDRRRLRPEIALRGVARVAACAAALALVAAAAAPWAGDALAEGLLGVSDGTAASSLSLGTDGSPDGAPASTRAADGGVSMLAATTLTVGGTDVRSGGYWTTDETGTLTDEGASAENYNVKYDSATGTLTLKDATINGTNTIYHVGAGIFASGDLTIVLEGSSTVKGVKDPNGETQSIRVEGNLTIQGGGSLTAQGAETSSGSSYGIFVFGSFTQQGGSVTATGGTSQNYSSTGLHVSDGTVTVQGGTLTATGGDTSGSSYGISMFSSVTVNDAIVTATGGTGKYSYGLHIQSSSPSVTISGSSSLTARSGTATNRAGGIYFQNPFGSTGSVTVGENSTLLTNSVILYDNSVEAKPLAPTGDGSWLIYGQSDQTSAVGGTYTLTDDLTIENGNTFTIPAGSTLNLGGHTLTVDGTLNIANQSSLAGEGTLEAGENSTFNLTNPEPVISGSETLTYDGTDHFNDFSLTAPSGTVEVMGKDFAISSSPSLEGWNLETQEIKGAGTYTLTAKHTDGRTVQKQVTVSKATSSISFNNYAPGKTYDGTALANPTESQLTITGAGYNDVTFTWYKDSVADANKLDSAPTDAGTYYLVASIPDSTNIIGSEATSGAITISPATISIASATVADKTYNGGTDATVEEVTFTGLATGEGLALGKGFTATATFADAKAGDSKQATVTVELINGNYTFGSNGNTATATAKIAPLPVVLEWSAPTTFTYDKNEHSVTATVTNKVGDDTFNLTYESNKATNAGTYTATVTALGNDNYTLTGGENTTQGWSITKADSQLSLTVDRENHTYTYGETIPFTVTPDIKASNGISLLAADTVTFKVGDRVLGSVSVTEGQSATFSYNTTAKILAPGTHTVTATYTGGNLNDISETIEITLNAKALTAVINGNTTKTYDGTTTATGLSLTLAGMESGDTVTAEAASYAYDSANVSEANTITASDITLSGEDAGNYALSSGTATANGAITPAALTVTAEAKSKTYGDADPALTYQVSGLEGDDEQGAVLSGALSREEGENVGDYSIAQGTLSAGDNYAITFKGADLTINPLAAKLTWDYAAPFTYDGSEKSVTATVANAVGSDAFTLAYNGNTATDAGAYTATVTALGNDNYTLTGATGTELEWSIGAAPIADAIVTLSPEGFTYNGQSQTPTVTVTLGDKTLTEGDYTVTYSGDTTDAGTVTVKVAGTGNYSGEAASQPTYAITKADQAALSITSTGPATYGQDYALTASGGSGSGAVTFTVADGTGAATVSGNTLTPTRAGDVTVSAVKAGDDNHNDGTSVSVTITISKGAYDGTMAATGSVIAGYPGSVRLPDVPEGASFGDATYSGGDGAVTGLSVDDSGTLRYAGGSGVKVGGEYVVTVKVTDATNYEDYDVTVTLTGAPRPAPAPDPDETETVTNPDGTVTTTVTHPDGSSTATTSTGGGTEVVVETPAGGGAPSVSASVSGEDASSGAVALPVQGGLASGQQVSVSVPEGGATVVVPVSGGASPSTVLALVGEGGELTVLPKTASTAGGLGVALDGDAVLAVVAGEASFPDLSGDEWFADEVAPFVASRGILTGVVTEEGTAEFRGGEGTNRAMFVTMLHRLELEPEAGSAAPFPDVAGDEWFAEAAAWGDGSGIVTGYEDGTGAFGGADPVTREQMAVFMFRYAQWLGLDTSARAELAFPDAGNVSDWAREAMGWAVAEGLFTGDDATGALRPTDGATRAEAAAVVMRLVNGVLN